MKSDSSEDNYTNKASSEMHTGSRFFFTSHLTPTLPFPCYRPPESLGLLTRGATIYQNRLHSLWVQARGMQGWHIVLLVVCGGVTFSTRHNTWPFVKHSHYRQRKGPSHIRVSKHMPPRGEQTHEIYPLPVWVQQSMRFFGCLMNSVVLP